MYAKKLPMRHWRNHQCDAIRVVGEQSNEKRASVGEKGSEMEVA